MQASVSRCVPRRNQTTYLLVFAEVHRFHDGFSLPKIFDGLFMEISAYRLFAKNNYYRRFYLNKNYININLHSSYLKIY